MRSPEILERLLATMDVTVRQITGRDIPIEPAPEWAANDALSIHYVRVGAINVTMNGRPPRLCPPGTMILFPPGASFTLSATGERAARIASATVVARLCGGYGLLDQARSPLLEDMTDAPLIAESWRAMFREAATERGQLGSSALMDALMKTCILTVIRRFVRRPGMNLRIVTALVDPRLGGAVAEIIGNPAAAHSVDSLATCAGLSRSTFARQFASALGSSPMEFVAKTRLYYAAGMLRSSSMPIKMIAAQIGFSSRSHFSRTFRDTYGIDPQTFRREEQLLD